MNSKASQNSKYFAWTIIWHSLNILFIILGLAGVALLCHSVNEITFNLHFIILTSVILTVALYITHELIRIAYYLILAASVVFCVVIIFSNTNAFISEFGFIFSGMVIPSGAVAVSVNHVASVFIILATLLFFMFEILFRFHVPLFIATETLMLLPTMFGYSLSGLGMILTAVFQTAFFVLPQSLKKNTMSANKEGLQKRIKSKGALITIALFLVSLVIAVPIVKNTNEKLFQSVLKAEDYFIDNLGLSPPSSIFWNSAGNINTGDNIPEDILNLKIKLSSKPEYPLYLRGYYGGNYYTDRWDNANEAEIYSRLLNASPEYQDTQQIMNNLSNLRYELSAQNNSQNQMLIEIKNENMSDNIIFSPYNSIRIINENGAEGSYSFLFFNPNDLNISFDTSRGEFLKKLLMEYGNEAYDVYTYITAECTPRLKEYIKNLNPENIHSVNEITEFILDTLNSHAKYTLQPGEAPDGVDVIDYFLFESGKGYCQQFASAATLMYRMFNIPSRYVTGYRIEPDSFEADDNGNYTADITDRASHAWTEIWVDEYGWMPVEVTPVSDSGDSYSSYMNEGSISDEMESDSDKKQNQETQTTEPETTSQHISQRKRRKPNIASNTESPQQAAYKQYLRFNIPIACVCAAIITFIFYRDYRIAALNKLSHEGYVKKLKKALSFLPDEDFSDITAMDLPQKLNNSLPDCSLSYVEKMRIHIMTVLYSGKPVTQDDTYLMRSYFKEISFQIMNVLRGHKKLLYKYIYFLI